MGTNLLISPKCGPICPVLSNLFQSSHHQVLIPFLFLPSSSFFQLLSGFSSRSLFIVSSSFAHCLKSSVSPYPQSLSSCLKNISVSCKLLISSQCSPSPAMWFLFPQILPPPSSQLVSNTMPPSAILFLPNQSQSSLQFPVSVLYSTNLILLSPPNCSQTFVPWIFKWDSFLLCAALY